MLAEINYAIIESCFIVMIFLFYVMNSFITAFIFEILLFNFIYISFITHFFLELDAFVPHFYDS